MKQCAYCPERGIITVDGDSLCERHAADAAHVEGHAARATRAPVNEFRTHGDSSAIDDNDPLEGFV